MEIELPPPLPAQARLDTAFSQRLLAVLPNLAGLCKASSSLRTDTKGICIFHIQPSRYYRSVRHTFLVKFNQVKFTYSEKATKFCEISTLLLFGEVRIGEISRATQELLNCKSHDFLAFLI